MTIWGQLRHEIRLYLAQVAIGWAIYFTPSATPEIYLLYEMIGKWKDLCKKK